MLRASTAEIATLRLHEPWRPALNGEHPNSPNLIAPHCAYGFVGGYPGTPELVGRSVPELLPISESFIPLPGLLTMRDKSRPT